MSKKVLGLKIAPPIALRKDGNIRIVDGAISWALIQENTMDKKENIPFENVLEEARELISRRFVDRRNQLGLSQQDVADRSGMGIATIKRFESAKFWIGLKQLLILCHVYDCYFFVEDKEGDTPLAKQMRDRWRSIDDNN